jgi:hypothetical protein
MNEKIKQVSIQNSSDEFTSNSNSFFLEFEFDSEFLIVSLNERFSNILEKLDISLEKNSSLFSLFPEENQNELENIPQKQTKDFS